MRKYYKQFGVVHQIALGGKRVAMRAEGVVYYLHGDHGRPCGRLGSTSLTTCGSRGGCGGAERGSVVARRLYHPYGAERYAEGALPTDFTFTGQRKMPGLGLMHYGARYYHPLLGRFISADTIVPEPSEPQDFNRYAYVRNNPLRFVDPSGHRLSDPADPEHDPTIPPPFHERPDRWVPQKRRNEARKCILGSAIFDTLATIVSLWGTEVEVAVTLVVASSDGPSPIADVPAPVAGVIAYQKTLGKVENWLGVGSSVNTIVADILDGYTYIDDDTGYGLPEVVVGQRTVDDLIMGLDSQLLGLIVPEAFVDTAINANQALDNWIDLSNTGEDPTWELRVTWDGGWYVRHYSKDK